MSQRHQHHASHANDPICLARRLNEDLIEIGSLGQNSWVSASPDRYERNLLSVFEGYLDEISPIGKQNRTKRLRLMPRHSAVELAVCLDHRPDTEFRLDFPRRSLS